MTGHFQQLMNGRGERCSSMEARVRDQIAAKLTAAQLRALVLLGDRSRDLEAQIRRSTVDVLSQYGLIVAVDWMHSGYAMTPRGRWVLERVR